MELAAHRQSSVQAGYKQTEVGVIPEDWDVAHLSSIADVRDGTHDSPKYFPNGVPFVTSKNILSGKIDFEDISFISPEDAFQVDKRSKVHRGDILISMIGTVGNAALIDFEPNFSIKNVALIKPISAIVQPQYLIQLFQSEQFANYLDDRLAGGIQKFVSLGMLRSLDVPLPPTKAEQEAIAGALSDADAWIESLEQLIAKKRRIKEGTSQALLTGKQRLPGFSGEWEVKRLGDISYMKGRIGWQGLKQTEFTMQQDDPFLITGMNFKNGEIRWKEVYHISEDRYEMAPEIQLKPNDLLMTKDGTIGKLLFVRSIPYPNKASLNSHLLLFRPIRDSYFPLFFYYLFQTKSFEQQIDLHKSGTTFFGITQGALEKFELKIPKLPEQTAIAAILSDMDSELDALESKLSKARQIKQGMMQELLTGKTRLV